MLDVATTALMIVLGVVRAGDWQRMLAKVSPTSFEGNEFLVPIPATCAIRVTTALTMVRASDRLRAGTPCSPLSLRIAAASRGSNLFVAWGAKSWAEVVHMTIASMIERASDRLRAGTPWNGDGRVWGSRRLLIRRQLRVAL